MQNNIAYIADISDASNRGFSFSVIAIGWGAGSILGATIGGLLVISHEPKEEDGSHRPSESALDWWLFGANPYLLPCAVGTAMAINAIIWTVLFVKDEAGSYAKTQALKGESTEPATYSQHELASLDYSKSLPTVSKSTLSETDREKTDNTLDAAYTGTRTSTRSSTRNFSLMQFENAAYTIEGTMNDTLRLKHWTDFSRKDKRPLLSPNTHIEISSLRDLFTKTQLFRTLVAIMTYAM